MKLTRLELQNFKNYEPLILDFEGSLICIVGLNGAGKTNLLDAIHYLAFTKSGFQSNDSNNIKKQEQFFLVAGKFQTKEEKFEIRCYQEKQQKKVFRKNKTDYEKLSDHIGTIPAVMFTPYDQEIILGGSEVRRKWLDGCISQYDASYLKSLLQYQRLLKQRNTLLKQMEGRADAGSLMLLDTYDNQLIPLSNVIGKKRNQFVADFAPYFESNISTLVQDHESCQLTLKSQTLGEEFSEEYALQRQKDILLQRTTMGSHRDDLVFQMNEEPIKKFGSQGQQKSFLISLKLAQYDHLFKVKNEIPLLLLDDVFDKLDDERIKRLLEILQSKVQNENGSGQVFITDARKERTTSLTKNLKNIQLLEIEEGKLAAS